MKNISYIRSCENPSSNFNNYKSAVIGALLANVICFVFLLIFAVLLTYTNIDFKIMQISSRFILYVGSLLSGIISTLKLNKNGWITGAISGIVFLVLIYSFILVISGTGGFSLSSIKVSLISLFFSMLGGIIGINIGIKK